MYVPFKKLLTSLVLFPLLGSPAAGAVETGINTTASSSGPGAQPNALKPGGNDNASARDSFRFLIDGHRVTTTRDASAFLGRATFGPSRESINSLFKLGTYEAWLQEQFTLPPSLHMQWAEDNIRGINGTGDIRDNPEDWKRHSDTLSYAQRDIWWHLATQGQDQLRQRVALAWSEILVTSVNNGVLITQPDARISYYDLLVRDAFSNFEQLLHDVTYHPTMGKYLSYLGNAKAGTSPGSHPDENYAREVMQLFTIGLYELNPDGSRKLDAHGKPIATYSQDDVREMARVFTGLTDQNGFFFPADGDTTHFARTQPMIAMEEYHDHGAKQILGHSLPGGDTRTDIDAALHILFQHPNTGPFICRQLIQRLVTSNPSPEYVARVSQVFNDNGAGVRGDMRAVISAILVDAEAFHGAELYPQHFGKFREPLLFITHLFRAFHARDTTRILNIYEDGPAYSYPSYHFHGTGFTRQEAPLEALTVFNYFTPFDAPYSLRQQGLVAPELEVYGKQGIDDLLMGIITRNSFVYGTYNLSAELQLQRETAWIKRLEYDRLLDELDITLTAGQLSASTRNAIRSYLVKRKESLTDNSTTDEQLARYVIGLIMTSPDYALQR
ncbi:DUF1800 domain-containing protein [Thiolapillus brandeum]|uniref:DUF1800 domain-containing protein n=1 Tax=Thiolapillus brandeum TaxID=1076588 RepID=A0A7U6GKL6_9GAMM|nr:DUF1800 domain-containing protein [Thiolapillus brandeum]BAO45403.1 conserved hypothetical protein [Thiolapillus brandeum]